MDGSDIPVEAIIEHIISNGSVHMEGFKVGSEGNVEREGIAGKAETEVRKPR